jgi:hypothetical protein
MKLAQAIFLFLIIWVSQVLTSVDKSVPVEEHVRLQNELTAFIQNYVQQNLPNSQNFKMHSIYTHPPRKGVIRAYFNYSFNTDGITTTQILGHAFLKKIKNEPVQEWSLEKIEIQGEQITFDEPIVITPEENN